MAAIPLGIWLIGAVVTYPATVLTAVVLGALAYTLRQRHKHAAALALRADYEHAALMAQPAPIRRPSLPVIRPANLPTVPLRTQGAR